jgi:hypothetical protein
MALKIGELWAALRLDDKQFVDGLDAAGQKATGFAGKMGQVGKTLTTRVSMPLVGVGAAAFKAASAQAAWAEELGNLNAATGLSTQRLQELKYIADTSGLSFEGLTNTTGVLQRKLLGIEEGGGPAAAVMTELGVSITGADGQMRSMNDLFPELIEKLQQVENPTRRNALSTQIFGRNVAEIAPILAMSKAEMDKMTQAARDSGKVMGDEAVKKLQAFDDAIDTITQKVQGFVTQAVAGFVSLPGPIQNVALALAGIAVLAGPLMQVAAAISAIRNSTLLANAAAWATAGGFSAMWAAVTGPVGVVLAALAAVAAAIYAIIKNWDRIKGAFGFGGGAKAPAAPRPAAAAAGAGGGAKGGPPPTVKFSPDVEAAIKKTAANTKPQPRFA